MSVTVKAICEDGMVRTATYRGYGNKGFVRRKFAGRNVTVTGRIESWNSPEEHHFYADRGRLNANVIAIKEAYYL